MLTVCHKDTGRKLISVSNLETGDKASKLITQGHPIVLVDKPEGNYKWDGNTWVIDQGLQAEADLLEKKRALAKTDAYTPRLTEDLITLLVSKGVISLEELPEAAKIKYQDRLSKRSAIV